MHGTWISVDERLPDMKPMYEGGPKTSELVLIFTGHYVSAGKYEEAYGKRTLRWEDRFGRRAHVTHWMPLPEPPEVGEAEVGR